MKNNWFVFDWYLKCVN